MARTRGKVRVDYGNELAVVRTRTQWGALVLLLAVLAALPHLLSLIGNASWLTFVNFTLITVIAVLGLNVTTGMAGQVSMGHSAFIMVGSYASGNLMVNLGWSFWLAVPAGALIAAGSGLVVGAPSVRLKGMYLAVATFAFFFVAQFLLKNLEVAGGPQGLIGIPSPAIGGFAIKTDIWWYYLILLITIAAVAGSVNLTRSRLGRAFFAVRDGDVTAPSMGINVYLTKVTAFFIGALFAGIAGGLGSSYISVVRTDQFTIWDSIWYLGMVIIGGAGSTAGTVMGVLFLRLISQFLHLVGMGDWARNLGSTFWSSLTYAIYGVFIILFMSFRPHGLISVWRTLKVKYKQWPFEA